MISLLKKKDSFSKKLNSESFFLLIKPTKNIYTNVLYRKLIEKQIKQLIKLDFINIEISWSDHENWFNYVSNLKLKFPKLNLGSASINSKKAIDESVNIGLKYSMMKVWDKNPVSYTHLTLPTKRIV